MCMCTFANVSITYMAQRPWAEERLAVHKPYIVYYPAQIWANAVSFLTGSTELEQM